MNRKAFRTVTVLILLAILFIGSFGARTLATSGRDTLPRAYSSVQILPGDTLWSISEEFCGSSDPQDIREYVRDLKEMNHIINDSALHPGAYIMIYTIKR
ncbi:MAG: LysM peptidoglycan-binding domain-containing protein [Lachnospiraceae bacterium]|nr:LysM peptidoglycan-binding domain-containing protein [Lachnospiraceae bacterium]